MNYHQHQFTGMVALILYLILVAITRHHMPGPLAFVSIFCANLPDQDKKMRNFQGEEGEKHRHWLFHSAIIPFLVLVLCIIFLGDVIESATFCVVIGTHLLCDLKADEKGKRGFYLIYIHQHKRLKAKTTDQWLGFGGLACYAVGLIALLLG